MKRIFKFKTKILKTQLSLVLIGLILILSTVSCKNNSQAIDELQKVDTIPAVATEADVKIKSFTPTSSPSIFTNINSSTYAVSLEDGAGAVTYNFLLDGVTVLQDGSSPFYLLNGNSLSLGLHTLKVTATNSRSSDSKTFNLRRNTPTTVLSYAPTGALNILNCDQDTLTMTAVTTDADNDSYTYKWLLDGTEVTGSTSFTTISNTASSAQLAYTPGCAVAGIHQFSLVVNDGYENTTQTWTINAVNPLVESIVTYNPTSNNITALSNENSKVFFVSGTGIGALTFVWKLDNVTVKTDVGVSTSTYTLNTTSGTLATGNHTLSVGLTDGITSNDPTLPVKRDWVIYKNQKPTILSPVPLSAKLINLNTALGMSASLQDPGDVLTTVITKGALDCVPASECGLSSVVLPTASGVFSTTFNSGTTFLGENNFQLKVTDSYGEFQTHDFTVTSNYFSDVCNSLQSGRICTLVGLPGLGGGLNVVTDSNKIRVTPAWLTQDHQGNWFFSDHATNTVWYYNTKTVAVTLWGESTPVVSVPAKSLYLVAGTGISGNSFSDGELARKTPLNFGNNGGGLAWDSDRKELFIADYDNNRVVKIGQDGNVGLLCGGPANLNTQNTLAESHQCNRPVDIEIDSTNRRLYVSLYGQNRIKYFNISAATTSGWTGFTLAGNGTAANVNGSTNLTAFPSSTIAGISQLNGPWGLFLDKSDNILYFTEYSSFRIRALGLPGSTTQNIGATSITANNLVTLAGSGNGSPTINSDTTFASNIASRPLDLAVEKDGALVRGIYFSDSGGNRISFMNNTAGNVTIGNQTIATMSIRNILGNGGSASTNPPSGKTTSILNPIGIYLASDALYVAAKGNNAIQSLPVASPTTNGTPVRYLGGVARASYSGNAALDSKVVTFNRPLTLYYHNPTKQLFVADSGNAMIRAINLTTGRVEDFIGTGAANDENLLNTVTTSTRIRSSRGMAFNDDFFLYADGANNNNFVRAYNTQGSQQSLYDTLIDGNRTNTVAGYYNLTGHFSGTAERSISDPLAMLGLPYGIGVNTQNDDLYISSVSSNCILRARNDVAGAKIGPLIGNCGTPASIVTASGSLLDSSKELKAPTEIAMDPANPRNFFFVDWSDDTLNSNIKYANTSTSSVTFFTNRTVLAGQFRTIIDAASMPGQVRALAVFGDWICFTSGVVSGLGSQTVECRNHFDGSSPKTFGTENIGGIQADNEQEGTDPVNGLIPAVTFTAPSGLAFDSEGNLYISEEGSHVIRKIRRWFP